MKFVVIKCKVERDVTVRVPMTWLEKHTTLKAEDFPICDDDIFDNLAEWALDEATDIYSDFARCTDESSEVLSVKVEEV